MLSPVGEQFEKFIVESFGEDIFTRELRLSNQEVDYLKKKYPKASVKLSSEKSSEGKSWYVVQLVALQEKAPTLIKRKQIKIKNKKIQKSNQQNRILK